MSVHLPWLVRTGRCDAGRNESVSVAPTISSLEATVRVKSERYGAARQRQKPIRPQLQTGEADAAELVAEGVVSLDLGPAAAEMADVDAGVFGREPRSRR